LIASERSFIVRSVSAQLSGGILRIAVAVVTLTLGTTIYPQLSLFRPLLAAYLVSCLVFQLLIWRQLGGRWRQIAAGLIDVTLLLFLAHRFGSFGATVVTLFFPICCFYTLACGLRIGLTLSVYASVGYLGIVLAEQMGWIPYAPNGPAWLAGHPGIGPALALASFLASVVLGFSLIVGRLIEALKRRERELAQLNAQLEQLSQRDPLTHLFNRRVLFERLETELARRQRGHAVSVAMLDLDGFKHINDSQGHASGDRLLVEIGDLLRAFTRATDLPTRYGGDELFLLLADTECEAARGVVERLRCEIETVGKRFDPARPVTASIGLTAGRKEDTVQSLVQRADELAYRAKRQGRNQIVSDAA
jgi:diguanylate cyclase (GGDEF)-like protein